MSSYFAEAKFDPDVKIQTNDPENGIIINSTLFATKEEVDASIKESNRKTEVFTLSERLSSIDKMSPIPTLKPSNWHHWCESTQNLIELSDTSAAFHLDPPRNKALTMWKTWWASKLRETAPDFQTAPSDNPRTILTKIVAASKSNCHNQNMNVVYRF